jgi:hypothetical protein
LGTQIDLLLNRDDADQLTLWKITDDIYETASIDKRNDLDAPFVAAGRKVMKNEWEKIKAEIRGTSLGWSRSGLGKSETQP